MPFDNFLYTIPIFVIIIGVLVFVHELGHFTVAKAFNIQVLEFGIGFPPRLVSIRRGETLYSINLIPLGGFVKLSGEENPTSPRSFASQPAWIRFLVLIAGPFMNILLPLVLFIVLFLTPQQVIEGQVSITHVSDNSPAQEAGIQPGDIVVKVADRTVDSTADLIYLANLMPNRTNNWLISRQGQNHVIAVKPRSIPPDGQGAIGITVQLVNPQVTNQAYSLGEAIPLGFERISDIIRLFANQVGQWFSGAASPLNDISGPIGIFQITGEVARLGATPLLELAAFLSISLAILNILPIPMLDGGKLAFIALEVIRGGKRISPAKEGTVHFIGFAVLIAFIMIISYFDLARIFRGENLLR